MSNRVDARGAGVDGARDLAALPKAHLHLHLIGSMRPATLAAFAQRIDVSVPPELRALACRVASSDAPWARSPGREHVPDVRGFARFDGFYSAAKNLVTHPGDLRRLVDEIVTDEAAEGTGWVELTANPNLYQGRFGPDEAVLELLLQAGEESAARTGVGVAWIVCADRRFPERAPALAELAVRYADEGVVGFGLANDERANPEVAFAGAFRTAVEAGLRSMPHAGELTGPASVRSALDDLGADRIGHGIAAAREPQLLDRLAEEAVCLEVSPVSNAALGLVDDIRSHPLPAIVAAGVPVALSADDPLLFGAGLTDQYRVARSVFGFGDDALADLARSSVGASCAPPQVRRRLLDGIDAWLARPA